MIITELDGGWDSDSAGRDLSKTVSLISCISADVNTLQTDCKMVEDRHSFTMKST